MRKILSLTLLGFLCFGVYAQEESVLPVNQDQNEESIKKDPYPNYKGRGAIALNFGAVGGGLEYAENFTQKINLRGRLTYFRLNDIETDVEFAGEQLVGGLESNVLIADILFEYLPVKRLGLKLVGGVSYLFNYDANVSAGFGTSLSYGDLTISPDQIGDLNINADWSGFAPYAGFGYGRAVPKSRFGFGIELGTHFAPSPTINVTATGSFSETASQEQQLQEDLKGYRWLPFAQFRLAYKL